MREACIRARSNTLPRSTHPTCPFAPSSTEPLLKCHSAKYRCPYLPLHSTERNPIGRKLGSATLQLPDQALRSHTHYLDTAGDLHESEYVTTTANCCGPMVILFINMLVDITDVHWKTSVLMVRVSVACVLSGIYCVALRVAHSRSTTQQGASSKIPWMLGP